MPESHSPEYVGLNETGSYHQDVQPRSGPFQGLVTVAAVTPKCSLYRPGVLCVCNAEFERSTYLAAEIMKKHANKFIRHIGLGP